MKVYRDKQSRCSVVSNDDATLSRILDEGEIELPEGLSVVWVDDAGVGCPIGGILVGAFDEKTGRFVFGDVPVEYFQGGEYEQRGYLLKAAEVSAGLLEKLSVNESEYAVKVCIGFVNSKTREVLAEKGFLVQAAKIVDPLQSLLEAEHRKYLEGLGFSFARDSGASFYDEALKWLSLDDNIKYAKEWALDRINGG